METIRVPRMPDCDVCPDDSKRLGVYNSPTRKESIAGGRWADLCGPHFEELGIDTSVTERRESDMDVPLEVLSIARTWAGREARVMAAEEGGPWRFVGEEAGFLYEVHAPGQPWPWWEDDGSPGGDSTCEGWHVRGLNDAPDAHFTVDADGTYRGYDTRPDDKRLW